MDVEPEFKPIFEKWGSEKAVYRFLRTEFDRINRDAFSGRLRVPIFRVKANEQNASGDYQPAERHRPDTISIYTSTLMDEDKTRRVLAHYMVHYWENAVSTDNDSEDYPAAVDEEISKNFPTGYRERAWRSSHSRLFISKAYEVAKTLSIPAREILLT